MARKVKHKKYVPSPYYGPKHATSADFRNPAKTQYDDFGQPRAYGSPPTKKKAKAVMRDPWQYDPYNKRPKRS